MPHDVFISHSTEDKLIALALCNKLESAGVRCWIAPRDVGPGEEWGKAIVDAISSCRLMVLIFSSKANESRHIRREVQTAFEKDSIVIPFRVENIQPTGTMEYYLGSVHWLDALTAPVENHMMVVVERVKALLPAAVAETAGDVTASAGPAAIQAGGETARAESKIKEASFPKTNDVPLAAATPPPLPSMPAPLYVPPNPPPEKQSVPPILIPESRPAEASLAPPKAVASSANRRRKITTLLVILGSLATVALLAKVGFYVFRPKPPVGLFPFQIGIYTRQRFPHYEEDYRFHKREWESSYKRSTGTYSYKGTVYPLTVKYEPAIFSSAAEARGALNSMVQRLPKNFPEAKVMQQGNTPGNEAFVVIGYYDKGELLETEAIWTYGKNLILASSGSNSSATEFMKMYWGEYHL